MDSPVVDPRNEAIRRHWEDAAANLYDAEGLKRTVRDHNLQDAVEAAMLAHLTAGDSLLDVGCGDGGSTVAFGRKTGDRVVAVDYIERFVSEAERKLRAAGLPISPSCKATPGDSPRC